MKIKLGFTGTQNGLNESQRNELYDFVEFIFKIFDEVELHHGDCIGADEEMHEIFSEEANILSKKVDIFIHPPDIRSKRAFCSEISFPSQSVTIHTLPELPYLERNHNIVDACDFLIGCPSSPTEQLRSGTWATIRYARKVGKKHEIYI